MLCQRLERMLMFYYGVALCGFTQYSLSLVASLLSNVVVNLELLTYLGCFDDVNSSREDFAFVRDLDAGSGQRLIGPECALASSSKVLLLGFGFHLIIENSPAIHCFSPFPSGDLQLYAK